MKRILSVVLATILATTSIIPSFAVTYERDESFENAYAVSERCNDFYKKSNNNYVVENGFLFDLDTQTIVQFDKNIYLETLMDKMLDGTTEMFASYRDIEKLNSVIIPETIAGKTVRFIGNSAFEEAGLTQVVIPSSVEKIGDFAFFGNLLTNTVLNEGLLEIGRCAFTPAQDSPIVVPSSVRYIDFQQTQGIFSANSGNVFILKNPDTKVNYFGEVVGEYDKPITREMFTVNPSAPLATEKYEKPAGTLSAQNLWCQYTENNGFTYGYADIYKDSACGYCGSFFIDYSDRRYCPMCKREITESDGTLLTNLTPTEQHRLFEEKHNGMDLREFVIDRLKTAGLITDEHTAIATDEEINTYLNEQVLENTCLYPLIAEMNPTIQCFFWKNGSINSNVIRSIVSYDSSLDETPEEITFSSKDERIASADIFDNLEKVRTVNLEIENIADWANNHCAFDFDVGEYNNVNDTLALVALDLLYSWGSCKLFTGCENINTVNILDSADYSGMTEEDIAIEKAMKSDCITLFLKRMLNTDFDNLTFPDGYEYIDGAVYKNDRTQLVAVVKDMETYEMPSTVTTVNNFAFSEITVKNVIWSENCKYIPTACFIRSNVQNIDFKNVTEIRDLAFYETNIKRLILPETLTTLGTLVFSKSQIESIDFPKSLTQSGYSLFSGCLKLNSTTLRSNIQVNPKDYDMLFGSTVEIDPDYFQGVYFSLNSYEEIIDDIDKSFFGFVPNLSNLNFGADITDTLSSEGFGYMPKLTNITVDESNSAFCVYKGFLLEKSLGGGSSFLGNVILAPNGMNFYNANDVPLWLFNSRNYIKPINSAVASTRDYYVLGMDINHLYMDDNEKMTSKENLAAYLATPNYFHSNIDFSYFLARSEVPDTLILINDEPRKININTEDNANAKVTLHNVTGEIYKIPCWTELTSEDVYYNDILCEYFGEDEYISITPDLIGDKIFSMFHFNYDRMDYVYADNTVKALRINGDIDLQANDFLQTLSSIMVYSDAYDLELTPNSVKSMFKDNAQMQAQVDKYTWNDGFLHFKDGFKYPILQCENPTDEILLDFVYNFLLPWNAAVSGETFELTFSDNEMKEILQLEIGEKLTVVDKDGFENENVDYDNFYFEYWVMKNYNWAKKYSSEFLAQSNITTFSEFKDWYINTLVFFDEETRTLEGMIGVRYGEYYGPFAGFSQLYPSHVNGVPVEHISLSTLINPLFGQVGGSYMYIPSTVKDVGYVSSNSSRYQEEIMAYIMLGEENGIYLTREKVKEKSEKVKLPTISLSYAPDSVSTLLNCFGLYSNAEKTYISPHNKYFKKLTSAGIQILSKDERVCYLATAPSPSSKTLVYAPASLFIEGAFDVLCNPAEFQTISYIIGVAYEGIGCSNCYIVLNDGESICPLCGSTELTEINESISMKTTYGATWMQIDDEEKQCATIAYASEKSPFAEHCKKEHYHANANDVCYLESAEGIESWTIEDREAYYETIASYNEYVLSESTIKSPDTYSLTTDSGALSYSNGQIFEKQIFMVTAPDKYRDSGYVIVEPFQMSKEVNLELKKGTVNLSVYDLDNEEYYTEKADFDVYNADDNTLFTTISKTNGSASSTIPYGEYYIVPHEIKGYAFEVERLPLSITEDGQIVNLSFNISVQPSYSLHIPEFLQATKAGEATINGEVSLKDVVLPKTKSLNVKVAYSGKLKEKSNESDTLSYILYSNSTAITNNSRILNVPYGTNHATIPIHAQITDEVLYAGVYTDTATFTVDVV